MAKIIVEDTTGEVIGRLADDNYIGSHEHDELKRKQFIERQMQRSQEQNFVFAIYNNTRKCLESEELKQVDITRLVVLSTYCGYDNRLMKTERTPMGKKDIKKAVRHRNNTSFKKFYDMLINSGIVYILDDEYYFNSDLFLKGKLGKLEKNTSAIRLYCDTIQYIFEGIKSTDMQRIGYVFQLLPYVHYDYNVLCWNPDERCAGDKVKPLYLKDIEQLLGISKRSSISFLNTLCNIQLKDGTSVLGRFKLKKDKRADKIVINPQIMYRGKLSSDKIQAIRTLFI